MTIATAPIADKPVAWFPSFGTSGIPALSSATAFNFGATYATPRVTITF